MRILQVALDWHCYDDNKRAESWAAHIAKLSSLGIETSTFVMHSHGFGSDHVIITSGMLIELMSAGVEVKIVKQADIPDTGSTSDRMMTMITKLEALMLLPGTDASFNSKCEVHMPGNAMLQFNETMLLEDCCTDQLQETLDKGWRIIAAQPQPDARRPDYILGRFNPVREPGVGGALRR